jgi:hypothetical protein
MPLAIFILYHSCKANCFSFIVSVQGPRVVNHLDYVD